MRGKPRSWRILPRVFGITPAGAGKTKSSSVKLFAHRDHPRRCGENYNTYSYRRIQRGSPPQVRGKHARSFASTSADGITPAGAGKTGGKDRSGVSNGDHPRRCGENVCRRNICMSFAGSPPQVRGKLDESVLTAIFYGITPAGAGKTPLIVPINRAGRITPAGAGKTFEEMKKNRPNRDHPRRCGENPS